MTSSKHPINNPNWRDRLMSDSAKSKRFVEMLIKLAEMEERK